MAAKTVLIVEDEKKLARLLQEYLEHAGYRTHCLDRGDLVMSWIDNNPVDLVILDLMLPGCDGMSLCKKIRQLSSIPVIIASAKVTEIDRLTGLEGGADDYICKPYSLREVVARVSALFRRTELQVASVKVGKKLQVGLFSCDSAKMSIYLGTQLLTLTVSEFRLLSYFLKNPEIVFTRDELLNNIYDDYRLVADRTIDTHIKNLRRKIQVLLPEQDVIQSIYGAGYKLMPPYTLDTIG